MLYLVSYEKAMLPQEQLIVQRLKARNAKQILNNVWILETNTETVLDVLWSLRLGENLRLFVADVSQSHFAASPYRDIRGLFLKPPEEEQPSAEKLE